MAKLDLYSGREPHTIEVNISGEKQSLLVPSDYTVEEHERILELEDKISQTDKDENTVRWDLIFQQLAILFRRYQPEMTSDKLKTVLTKKDALRIMDFLAENSIAADQKSDDGEIKDKAKKKAQGTS